MIILVSEHKYHRATVLKKYLYLYLYWCLNMMVLFLSKLGWSLWDWLGWSADTERRTPYKRKTRNKKDRWGRSGRLSDA